MNSELLTKAQQAADMAYDDIRDAHRHAPKSNPLLELLLRDVLADAQKIRSRLSEIMAAEEGSR